MNSIELSKILNLSFGGWFSNTLFALNEFRIFDILFGKELTLAQVQEQLGMERKGFGRLLNAGVALQLLKLSDGKYRNTSLAQQYLAATSPQSISNWLRIMAAWSEDWCKLGECISEDRSARDQGLILGGDPRYQEIFIRGMHEYARLQSDRFAELLDLESVNVIHDIGGGMGTYSIAACKRKPSLRAVVYDLEGVIRLADEEIANQGLSSRMSTKVCDYETDMYGSQADMLLLSNIMHQEDVPTVRKMLRKAMEALRPGGKLVVQSYFLSEDGTSPLFAALHNLSAIIVWKTGESYSVAKAQGLLEEAGFVAVSPREKDGIKIIEASKP